MTSVTFKLYQDCEKKFLFFPNIQRRVIVKSKCIGMHKFRKRHTWFRDLIKLILTSSISTQMKQNLLSSSYELWKSWPRSFSKTVTIIVPFMSAVWEDLSVKLLKSTGVNIEQTLVVGGVTLEIKKKKQLQVLEYINIVKMQLIGFCLHVVRRV